MKPFDYRAPTSLEEAVALLNHHDVRVRPLAGGTDLLVQLRSGRVELDRLVNIKRISATNILSYHPSEGLTIGAAVPCHRLYEDPQTRNLYPALADSASLIGGVAVQGRATIGGNVCNSAPSGDSLPTLIVLGSSCRIIGPRGGRVVPVEQFCTGPGSNVLERGELLISLLIPPPRPNSGACYLRFIPRGERVVPAEQFCTGPGRNVLERGELLVSLLLPPPLPNSGACYLRFIPRGEMDLAVAGVGARVDLNEDLQMIASARIALGAVAPTPILAREAGEFLVGKAPSEEAFGQAASLAQKAARPITDMRGTISYRLHLVKILVRRGLQSAVDRARKNSKEK